MVMRLFVCESVNRNGKVGWMEPFGVCFYIYIYLLQCLYLQILRYNRKRNPPQGTKSEDINPSCHCSHKFMHPSWPHISAQYLNLFTMSPSLMIMGFFSACISSVNKLLILFPKSQFSYSVFFPISFYGGCYVQYSYNIRAYLCCSHSSIYPSSLLNILNS